MNLEGVTAGGAVSAALAQKEAYAQQDAQVTMLKKAIDMNTQGALAMIDSIVPSAKLPDNLGQNVNTKA